MGLLPVDKPAGPTSHDLVAQARRGLGTRRVGHAGTLDPFASGLLLLCVGTTTRLVEYLHHLDKRYEAEALLGVTTDSDDREGEVLVRSEAWNALDEEAIRVALEAQVGTRLQRPPALSAKKVGGEAAHRKVRRGEEVDLPAVPVTIHEVALLEVALPRVRFSVRCGTGTYIRSMARELGESLGCGAHLVELRRTAIGPFSVEEALPAEDLVDPTRARERLLPPAEAVRHLARVEVDDAVEARLRMGQRVALADLADRRADAGGVLEGEGAEQGAEASEAPVAIFRGPLLVGIGSVSDAVLRPRKILPLEAAPEEGAA